jgi:phosphoglycerate kinase
VASLTTASALTGEDRDRRPARGRRRAAGKPPLSRRRRKERPGVCEAELAKLGDIYVNDAFSAAHRAHASTEGLAKLLPAYPGLSMERELNALDAALGNPQRPVIGIVGGSKVSTKLDLLKNLVTKLDKLAIGGGMANTFLYAQGHDVGASYCEKDLAETAREIIGLAGEEQLQAVPADRHRGRRAMEPRANAERVRSLGSIDEHERILDAGPETVEAPEARDGELQNADLERPAGRVRNPALRQGHGGSRQEAARLAKAGKLVAVAGGGDTVSAMNHAGVADDLTFISTAGGAFLEWMEGKELPGVEALKQVAWDRPATSRRRDRLRTPRESPAGRAARHMH